MDDIKIKYDYIIDSANENTTHSKILSQVGFDKTVLEIGCSSGYMTEYMKNALNCQVYGIELDENAARKAQGFCEKLLIADVEVIDFKDSFSGISFDVIIMADVLEHLKDAQSLLTKIKPYLKENGYILISIPNGAHGSLSLNALDGNWSYRSMGLMDETHLRFFDKDSFNRLLEASGFFIAVLDRIIVHPRDTEFKTSWDNYPRQVTAYIEKVNPEYQTYQFVIKAYPANESGWKKGLDDCAKFEKERSAKLDEDISALKKEVEQIHSVYAKEIEKLNEEASSLHAGYGKEITDLRGTAEKQLLEINRLNDEIKIIHSGYSEKIKVIDDGIELIHLNYNEEISRLSAEISSLHESYVSKIAEIEAVRRNEDAERVSQINHLRSEIEIFAKKEQRLMEYVSSLESERNSLSNHVNDLSNELDEIRNSVFWKFITRYRRSIEYLLPQGTRRRRLYQLAVLSPVVLFREGGGEFLRRILIRIPGLSRFYNSSEPVMSFRRMVFPSFENISVSIVIPVFNKCDYTLRCLLSILENTTNIPYEVIVVDNASSDSTPEMLKSFEGIVVIRNGDNKGFVEACNIGAGNSKGEFILFLNNDTEVTPGWLESMCQPFEEPKTGLVGAKLVYPDGTLQEAGNIIWQDASGWNYGRGDDPKKPEYSYRKKVDYCSGACLQIRQKLWTEIGGFDQRYAPAYYEDTDLCFEARRLGYDVVYQPEAVVIHYEGISSGTDITKGYKRFQQINHAKFLEKWKDILEESHYKGPEYVYLARERCAGRRILVADHYVPEYDKDSGSLRMYSLLKILNEMGHKVVFWPENRAYNSKYTAALQKIGIEACYGAMHFDEFMKQNGSFFDYIILSRPHIAEGMIYAAKNWSKAKIIYDTVDLHYLREGRKARQEAERAELEWKKRELGIANQADFTLVVSGVEKNLLELEGIKSTVSVVTNIHSLEDASLDFEKRSGIMFIGGFMHTPNEDAMLWFVEEIWPIIKTKIENPHFYIVGSHPSDRIKALAAPDITVTGFVEDVAPFFTKARVFVSPLRYGAGVKGKIGQSLSFGLPVVTTDIGAEGMGLVDGENSLIADDVDTFASKVIELYNDRILWQKLADGGRILIQKRFSPEKMRENLLLLIS